MGFTDLVDTHRWGLRIFILLSDVTLSITEFYDSIKGSWWELVTTRYLDPNAYKKGKDQATSQIEFRSQNEQTGQRSYTNSTLNITNGEAVSHHYSYDRQVEKEMGSTMKTAKTPKILGQTMAKTDREKRVSTANLMPRLKLDDPMAYQNFIRMPPELFQELKQRLDSEIQREMTWMRDPLSPGLNFAVTLTHLASGESLPILQYAFRVARSTINKFLSFFSVFLLTSSGGGWG